MGDHLFRKNALEHMSSPEQLDSFIHVPAHSALLALLAILVLTLGSFVWAFTGSVEDAVQTKALVLSEETICFVTPDTVHGLEEGMTVRAGQLNGTVDEIALYPMDLTELRRQLDAQTIRSLGVADDALLYRVTLAMDGTLNELTDARIIRSTMRPISYLFR